MKILMVCLGNICRSPLAEGIMINKLKKLNDNSIVDSVGTGAWHVGTPPDKRSIIIANKYGIDITNQRARKITIKDLYQFDLILTMDEEVQQDVLDMANTDAQKVKIFLLLEYAGNKKIKAVPDPFTGDLADFDYVYTLLDEACSIIAKKLVELKI